MGTAPSVGSALNVFPFFVGCGRSGTTLLRSMFDSHPELAIPYESSFIVPMGRAESRAVFERQEGLDLEAFLGLLRCQFGFRAWHLSEADVRAALFAAPPATYADAIRQVFALYAKTRGKPRYGDKTTIYILGLPMLGELFPEARFVHLIRDGRDVALSWLDTGWDWGPGNAEEAALHWRYHVQRGRRGGREVGPERYREVRYEDLVNDPEAILRQLCPFLGMEFDDTMLRYFERADDVLDAMPRPQHHQNLRLPPTTSVRNWRRSMSGDAVASYESVAGGLLADLGYPLSA